MITLLFVFCVALFCVYFVRRYPEYRRRQECLDTVPGPKPYFIIGNGLELTNSRKLHTQMLEWVKQYGPVYKISIGPQIQYIVTDPDLIEFVTTNNDLLVKGNFYKFLKNLLGEGLLTSHGEKWKSHRKAITPTFHFKILEQFIEIFHKNENILVKKLEGELGKDSFDVWSYITLCTLDIISEAAMGVSINSQEQSESEYVKAVKTMLQMFVQRSFSILHQSDFIYQFTSTCRTEQKAIKVLNEFTDSVIKRRRNELLSNGKHARRNGKPEDSKEEENGMGIKKKKALLDMLLETTIDGKPLTDFEIREEVDTFMFTGHDTTASSISFILYCLATYSDVQKKVVQELDSIFQGDKDHCATYAELQEMRYLDNVIKEVLRIYSIAPLIARTINKDLQFGKYTFVKGSSMILYLQGIHMDPKHFPNPEKFDPDRFEGESNRHIFSYVPFSSGQRNCIGQKFAQLEMKAVVSKILMNYELVPAVPQQKPIVVNEGVLKSQNGIRIGIRRRIQLKS